jgi:hypothetical protein
MYSGYIDVYVPGGYELRVITLTSPSKRPEGHGVNYFVFQILFSFK